jgi:Mlc titration factor MtfA (ptsG expression regulator)
VKFVKLFIDKSAFSSVPFVLESVRDSSLKETRMFGWFAKNRRKKIMAGPFPSHWEKTLQENVCFYRLLDNREREDLRGLIQIFVYEKNWEGCGGLDLTDEMRVTIAAMACLLILRIPHNYYENVETILVYPSDLALPERKIGFFETVVEPIEPSFPITGQAFEQGPLILVWDAVEESIRHAGSGYNVVFHEFAHKLDMQDGAADGTPPLRGASAYSDWSKTLSREYSRLLTDVQKGRQTFLDEYGATDEAEFFAVATEHFFDQPREMVRHAPELYRVLKKYYCQDPAARLQADREADG